MVGRASRFVTQLRQGSARQGMGANGSKLTKVNPMTAPEYQKAEIRKLSNGGYETECLTCGETLIVEQEDVMEMYVGENPDGSTEMFGVFCALCTHERDMQENENSDANQRP